jgi:nitroimidazol reductase NimA-like FMN-containing flavoprotein (pyridoxamine 5'-phosphate oxidase superfamily)
MSKDARRSLLNLTTATKENALSEDEREAFLQRKLVARLGTNRRDGWWHLTPIWYFWDEGRFYLSLGNSRRHLANMREDDHVTLCIDVDKRPEGVMEGPVSVVCFGHAKLIEEPERVREITDRLELRYLGSIPPEFEEAMWFEGRTAVEITPVRWLAWDQGKA